MLSSIKILWIDYENIDDGKLRSISVVCDTDKVSKEEVIKNLKEKLVSLGIEPLSVVESFVDSP